MDESSVSVSLASHQARFACDVLVKYRHDGRGLEVVNDNRPGMLRLAGRTQEYLHLMVMGALLGLAGFAAYECLVGLYNAAAAAQWSRFAAPLGFRS